MSVHQRANPIVIVTGANAGVGYAICHRLLLQLAQRIPPDSLPQRSVSRSISIDNSVEAYLEEFTECEGLTLILACRTVSKAEEARSELLKHLDDEVERIKRRKGGADGKHAESFRNNVQLVVHRIDLASVESVFSFARVIESKYPYVSHLVCNAGVASFTGYNWPIAFKQLIMEFVNAVTRPLFKMQRMGQMSEDGLGWIWQCNVFGHYVLLRLLEPILTRYKSISSSPARVLWMSSIEARADCYDPTDWQLVRNPKPYEASKYQIDLLVGWLEQQQQRMISKARGKSDVPVRYLLFHPGIVRTNIALKSLNSTTLDYCMQLSFLMAHFLGSTLHVITPYKSAISAVHLMLVALPFVTVAISSTNSNSPSSPSTNSHKLTSPDPKAVPHSTSNGNSDSQEHRRKRPTPLKFGSEVDYWFNEYVGTEEVAEWEERQDQAAELVENLEKLFRTYKEKHEAHSHP